MSVSEGRDFFIELSGLSVPWRVLEREQGKPLQANAAPWKHLG